MIPTDCMAQAVYYEARGQSRDMQVAVAQVVRNRGGKNYCKTVYNGCQFSWVCATVKPPYGNSWVEAKEVAMSIVDIPDNTDGATHFHTMKKPPYWAKNMTHTVTYGTMKFYRE